MRIRRSRSLLRLQRVVQLGQAVVAELQIARPVGRRRTPAAPRRPRAPCPSTVPSVAWPATCFAGRVDHVERRAAAGELQFAVDQHPLVAGQHSGFVLHAGHALSITNFWRKCHALAARRSAETISPAA